MQADAVQHDDHAVSVAVAATSSRQPRRCADSCPLRRRARLAGGGHRDSLWVSLTVPAAAWVVLSHKPKNLFAVAQATLDGLLDAAALRAVDPDQAIRDIAQIKGLVRSAQSWSSSAAPTRPMSCRAMNTASTTKSPCATGWGPRLPKCRKHGARFAAGPRSTCARCASSGPMKWVARQGPNRLTPRESVAAATHAGHAAAAAVHPAAAAADAGHAAIAATGAVPRRRRTGRSSSRLRRGR